MFRLSSIPVTHTQSVVINSVGVNRVTHTLIREEDSDVNTKECV